MPGLIDADYLGNIWIMVQTLGPPIHIPKGTQLTQLMPFKAKVPRKGVMLSGDGGFGSTGTPQVMFTIPLSGAKPIKPITFQCLAGGTLTTKPVLLDTGSNVTIVPLFAWPAAWPLNTLGTPIMGVGGMQMTHY